MPAKEIGIELGRLVAKYMARRQETASSLAVKIWKSKTRKSEVSNLVNGKRPKVTPRTVGLFTQALGIPRKEIETLYDPSISSHHNPRTELEIGQSTINLGSEIRLKTKILYETLGYSIREDIIISGIKLDLIAVKTLPGIGDKAFMICMERNPIGSKNCEIDNIKEFIHNSYILRSRGHIDGSVYVANAKIDADCKRLADGIAGMSLLTYSQLEKEIFYNTSELAKQVLMYEQSEIVQEYIPLTGIAFANRDVPDIVEHLISWSRKKQPLVVVSGDFGTGKSTIIDRIHYAISKAFIGGESSLYPYTFRLRNLLKYNNVGDFVSATLRDKFSLPPARHEFENMLTKGNLLILLDGFDEIDTGATYNDRVDYLVKLSYLIGRGSPTILTTRATYFESFDEMVRTMRQKTPGPDPTPRNAADEIKDKISEMIGLPKADEFPVGSLSYSVKIKDLSESDILTYIAKLLSGRKDINANRVMAYIRETYNLEDLARRPILLKMILVTILSGRLSIEEDKNVVGPSVLYYVYTNLCAERDEKKENIRNVLNSKERLAISQYIAVNMFERGVYSLSKNKIMEIIETSPVRKTKKNTAVKLENVFTDVRVCAFLAHDDGEHLKFTHRSFVEYFFANHIVENNQRSLRQFTSVDQKYFTKVVIYFLGSFLNHNDSFRKLVISSVEAAANKRSVYDNTLASILWTSGTTLSDRVLEKFTIKEANLSKSNVKYLTLRNVSFQHSTIKSAKFDNWQCSATKWVDSEIALTKVSKSNLAWFGERLRIVKTVFEHTKISIKPERLIDAIAMHLFSDIDCDLRNCNFKESKVVLSGRIYCYEVDFYKCRHVHLESNLVLSKGSKLKFYDSTISGSQIDKTGRTVKGFEPNWVEDNCSVVFEKCYLKGLWMSGESIEQIASRRGSIKIIDCKGIILFEDLRGVVDKEHLRIIRDRFPHIAFISLFAIRETLRLLKEELKKTIEIGQFHEIYMQNRMNPGFKEAVNRKIDSVNRIAEDNRRENLNDVGVSQAKHVNAPWLDYFMSMFCKGRDENPGVFLEIPEVVFEFNSKL